MPKTAAQDVAVCIIGAGPVGATLAATLAEAGLPTAVVDAAPLPPMALADFDGRAYAIALTSQRLLAAAGIWERLPEPPCPIAAIRVADGRPGEPASPLANGGAFGSKRTGLVQAAARALADEHGRAVVVRWSREDTVRLGPKRPPLAAGVRPDGTGVVRVARTPGIAAAIPAAAPGLEVVEVDVPGPPTSADVRGAGWVEGAVLAAVAGAVARGDRRPDVTVTAPGGGRARAEVGADGSLHVTVAAGDPLDTVVLRSYVIGAAHAALSWVTAESLTVDGDGVIHDLTVRSFGIVPAIAMVPVEVVVEPDDDVPVAVSEAVLAAVAAAVWLDRGLPPSWPCT